MTPWLSHVAGLFQFNSLRFSESRHTTSFLFSPLVNTRHWSLVCPSQFLSLLVPFISECNYSRFCPWPSLLGGYLSHLWLSCGMTSFIWSSLWLCWPGWNSCLWCLLRLMTSILGPCLHAFVDFIGVSLWALWEYSIGGDPSSQGFHITAVCVWCVYHITTSDTLA